eukprot:sb/3475821/
MISLGPGISGSNTVTYIFRGKIILPVNRGSGKSGPGKSGSDCQHIMEHCNINRIQSDPDLPGPDLPEPRFTGRKNFPRFRNLTVYHPDIPGTPIYRAKPFPQSIPVNRGSTVYIYHSLLTLD